MSSHGHFHGFMPVATPEMINHQGSQLKPDGSGTAPAEGSPHHIVVVDDEADAPMRAIAKLLGK
jgi:hypothetical protein